MSEGSVEVEAMDGGVPGRARGVFWTIAFVIFTAASGYLLLELVIALSAQGEPTGGIAPFTGAEFVYPIWYQAPEFGDAVRAAAVAYPVAAVFYGMGTLSRVLGQQHFTEQLRLPAYAPPSPDVEAGEAETPAIEATDDICVVSAERRIEHITLVTARLFGLTPEDMRGHSLEVFLSPGDLPKLDALVAAAFSDRARASAATLGILLAEAVVAPVDMTCRPAEADGMTSPGAAILTIRPASERGRLDDQLAALWY